ncbi:MAG: glycosyltransferase [Planctomycetota bacterium]|nr:glycosyltransferase [Planctomycetota bacterium]
MKLSIVIPCYNESKTLRKCVEDILCVDWDGISTEIIIVDDGSKDSSLAIAHEIETLSSSVRVIAHAKNSGKGSALRTGFAAASGDFVAVQDADMEYSPSDLRRLLEPLIAGDADVVFGSRFLTTHAHRVLHFWHSQGNRFLTLLSNMFTDMNLTDMETCYKVFRREIIQSIKIEENRFGFEPEVVAKIADMRCRVYEMGISYRGRTYDEGKKIGIKDGFRALYCIVRYNAHRAALPIQFMVYLFIGGTAAIVNLILFLGLLSLGLNSITAALLAFVLAAVVNYWLCIKTIFRHNTKWGLGGEIASYIAVVALGAIVDSSVTFLLLQSGAAAWIAKLEGTLIALVVNFAGRRFVVFAESTRGPWR